MADLLQDGMLAKCHPSLAGQTIKLPPTKIVWPARLVSSRSAKADQSARV